MDQGPAEGAARIYLLGAGAHARETLCIYQDVGRLDEVAGCLVDPEFVSSEMLHGKPVLDIGGISQLTAPCLFLAAMGTPRRREMIGRVLEIKREACFDTVIHPRAIYSEYVSIGQGVTIAAACVLTTEVTLSDHVILNCGCLVHHDASVGACTTLSPRVTVCGRVVIGEDCFVGAGATILPGVRIGCGVFVGAGSVVTEDIPDHSLAVGVPARVVRRNIRAEDFDV